MQVVTYIMVTEWQTFIENLLWAKYCSKGFGWMSLFNAYSSSLSITAALLNYYHSHCTS